MTGIESELKRTSPSILPTLSSLSRLLRLPRLTDTSSFRWHSPSISENKTYKYLFHATPNFSTKSNNKSTISSSSFDSTIKYFINQSISSATMTMSFFSSFDALFGQKASRLPLERRQGESIVKASKKGARFARRQRCDYDEQCSGALIGPLFLQVQFLLSGGAGFHEHPLRIFGHCANGKVLGMGALSYVFRGRVVLLRTLFTANVVHLLGFCIDLEEGLFLVYKYASSGSLERHIH
ncbi:hypothetical protein LINPERPRIM_LOCUS22052, partial [Linum perenne]